MKRIGKLFKKAFSRENLYEAYLDARKGKRKKCACFLFEKNLGANLEELYQNIHSNSYEPEPYFKFYVYEPKKRIIYAPAFKDIVVQHAIYRIIRPIFDKTFINTSFGCRKGYGTHRASRYAQKALRQYDKELYTLKLDIRKYFYSINRGILRKLIERKIKDKKFVDILMTFAIYEDPIGIPIGNLLSQIYALIYMNPLDHYVKRILKVKYYVRYVDDFILFGLTRDKCFEYKYLIIIYLKDNLHLILSKFTIQKIKKGVNFVGYRTWQSYKLIRKYSLCNFKRSVKNGKLQSIISLLGHAKDTLSLKHMLKIIKEMNKYAKNIQIPKSYLKIYNLYSH